MDEDEIKPEDPTLEGNDVPVDALASVVFAEIQGVDVATADELTKPELRELPVTIRVVLFEEVQGEDVALMKPELGAVSVGPAVLLK